MYLIQELHTREFGQKPQVVVEVPGVCTLVGIFAEFCGGFSIVGTSSDSLFLSVSERGDSMVRLYNATLNDRKRFSLANIKYRKEDRWGNYIKGVVSTLVGERYAMKGMNITASGSLMYEDAMSVSTSLALGTCLLLNAYYSLGLDNKALIRIAWQANAGFNDEMNRVSDMIAMLDCREGKVLFFDQSSLQYHSIDFPFSDGEGEWQTMILDSRIAPMAMREEMELKRRETKRAFAELRKLKPSGAIREFPEGDLHARAVSLPESVRHICTHVLMESRQAQNCADLLRAGDAISLGRLMVKVQNGLRDLMEMTCPEVDWLVKRATELPGCIGALQVSNGLAGNLLLLLSKDAKVLYSKRLEEYDHIFGFHPRWDVYKSNGNARIVYP